jgi:hypothetical protein
MSASVISDNVTVERLGTVVVVVVETDVVADDGAEAVDPHADATHVNRQSSARFII